LSSTQKQEHSFQFQHLHSNEANMNAVQEQSQDYTNPDTNSHVFTESSVDEESNEKNIESGDEIELTKALTK